MPLLTRSNQFWDITRCRSLRWLGGCTLACVVVYASGCSAPVARRSAGFGADAGVGESASSAAVAFLPQGSTAVSDGQEYWARQADVARRDAGLSVAGSGYQPLDMWQSPDVPTVERPYYINTWRSSESYLIFRRGSYETRGWHGSR